DPTGTETLPSGKDRVVVDSPLLLQVEPDAFREGEVGGLVAVQVADLPPAHREGELASPSWPRADPGPSGDRFAIRSLALCRLEMTASSPDLLALPNLQVKVNLKSSLDLGATVWPHPTC